MKQSLSSTVDLFNVLRQYRAVLEGHITVAAGGILLLLNVLVLRVHTPRHRLLLLQLVGVLLDDVLGQVLALLGAEVAVLAGEGAAPPGEVGEVRGEVGEHVHLQAGAAVAPAARAPLHRHDLAGGVARLLPRPVIILPPQRDPPPPRLGHRPEAHLGDEVRHEALLGDEGLAAVGADDGGHGWWCLGVLVQTDCRIGSTLAKKGDDHFVNISFKVLNNISIRFYS